MRANQLLVLCFVACTCNVFAQPSNSTQKKNPNNTRLELVYKRAQVTEYSNYGPSRSYSLALPYLKVNDQKPFAIDKKADNLRDYLSRCWAAEEQLDLRNYQRRQAKLKFYGGFALGAACFFSTLSGVNKENGEKMFFAKVGLGSALMFAGGILARNNMMKAQEHLRMSVEIYNQSCYKPTAEDSLKLVRSREAAAAKALAGGTPSPKSRERLSDMKFIEDTVKYGLERNDPSNSGLFGVVFNPAIVDINSTNLNVAAGAGLFYTYKSKLAIRADVRRAYLDNLIGARNMGEPYGVESYGIASSYKKATNIQVMAKYSLKLWEKESSYHLALGRQRMENLPVNVVGKTEGLVTKALTARLGYMMDNRVIESENGINFQTTNPEYAFQYQNRTYMLRPENLSTSATMMKSGIVIAGIGLTRFSDFKMKLQDMEFRGRREEKTQSETYFDVLYAHSLELQDMIYYHSTYYVTGSGHQAQTINLSTTPLKRLGARIGKSSISMFKPNFGLSSGLELGIRPGVDASLKESLYLQMSVGLVFGGRKG